MRGGGLHHKVRGGGAASGVGGALLPSPKKTFVEICVQNLVDRQSDRYI